MEDFWSEFTTDCVWLNSKAIKREGEKEKKIQTMPKPNPKRMGSTKSTNRLVQWSSTWILLLRFILFSTILACNSKSSILMQVYLSMQLKKSHNSVTKHVHDGHLYVSPNDKPVYLTKGILLQFGWVHITISQR